MSIGLGCIDGVEVELWDECYNIETTTFINFSYQEGSDYPPLSGEIPPEIGELINMTDLYLGGNELTIIPPEIGNLVNLQSLYLYGNQFTSIPQEIGNLINLRTLDIDYNQITELPDELFFLSNLELLRLEYNQLSGEIPSEIGYLINLEYLYLRDNQFSGQIPLEIGNLTNLNGLFLYNNQLTGEISDSLCSIQFIGLSGNNFNTQSNSCLVYMFDRSYKINSTYDLQLGQSGLEGEIPPEIGDLVNLRTMTLSLNQLTGPIPSEIGNLTKLTNLYLYDNQLSGEIPESIGNLINLEYLYLKNNQLSGEIPSSIENLTNLGILELSGNLLTGSIPFISGIVNMNLDNNNLNTDNHSWMFPYIDPDLWSGPGNSSIIVSNNQLSGEIPLEFWDMCNFNLIYFDLSYNQLSGEISQEIDDDETGLCGYVGQYPSMNLSNNELSGLLPQEICDTDRTLNIQNNYFCPSYPECLSEEEIGYQDTSNCEEECPDSIEGDLNYDGIVNILDVVSIVNCILSDSRCDICFDINYDGEINVVDIISLVNIILDI